MYISTAAAICFSLERQVVCHPFSRTLANTGKRSAAIIAILAALLFPVFARVREKGWQTTCLSNEKQIAAAVLMYMQDYDETFPFVLDWSGNEMGDANEG